MTRPDIRREDGDHAAARSKWPAAQHLQQAADQLRDLGPDLHPDLRSYADPVAEWLDKTANEMAWLAPYRDHEGGRQPWRVATRIAHTTLGLPNPDTCPTCHTRVRPGTTTEEPTA
ncbi:hypothetical protein [Streptomyces sp. NPDC005799]|uniref:hypothetical protein n=1 Tax=Streptomyces sp. NPDC005799 TaxID=3154678 RepID=UPI0033D5666E